ncbi:hypothetical protein [Shewanella putrefaciens]|uniref:ABC transporter permease n=1 Tax=Shewanella putrefaciens TaxID=24 RepID=A0ABX8XBH9_SHEPU|nr:hypothetical protein [Shewanella putrefaciens]AVV84604.1 ABC transporter permease [Shewanella putrefaciens]QSE49393.1 ABC transporter permease [Shewanella putrefaciens]QYX72801.1 ABC transporter permease [Shewanella putrefaciens]GGN26441.1 ABC transporter permease [Shewanella putrefaciens]
MSAAHHKQIQVAKGKRTSQRMHPFMGILRLWCFDIGSISFLGTGLLSLVLGGVAGWFGQKDSLELFLSMGVVSVSAAIAWQFIRLMASECSQLIPNYRRNIFIQSGLILSSVIGILLILCVSFGFVASLPILVLALVISLGFIGLCLLAAQWFYAAFLLFMLMPFISLIERHIPLWLSLSVLLIMGIVIIYQCRTLPWRGNARVVYLNGLEMGWFWLPNLQSMRILSRFERYLHPTNFFIGPMLTILLLLLPIFTLGLGALSLQLQWDFPILLLLAQFSVISCSLVHWSRVQRSRATETLLLMPGFNGRQGLINAFYHGQQRLLNVIAGMIFVCSLLLGGINGDVSLLLVAHLTLSTYCACALILGFGCMCRRVLHVTLTMMIVAGHSLWVSISLASLRGGSNLTDWLLWDILLSLVAQVVLVWGKKTLWKSDIMGAN